MSGSHITQLHNRGATPYSAFRLFTGFISAALMV
jgi:hypothetical protein